MEISYRRLSEYVTRNANGVIQMNFHDLGIFSDQYNQEIYNHGRETAREVLPQIQQVILEKLPPRKEDLPSSWMFIE